MHSYHILFCSSSAGSHKSFFITFIFTSCYLILYYELHSVNRDSAKLLLHIHIYIYCIYYYIRSYIMTECDIICDIYLDHKVCLAIKMIRWNKRVVQSWDYATLPVYLKVTWFWATCNPYTIILREKTKSSRAFFFLRAEI